MNCIIDLRQLQKPQQNKTLNEPVFFLNTSIHYEVHYLPNHLYMNLKSYQPEPISFPLKTLTASDDGGNFRSAMFTLLSRTLIPQPNFDSIVDSVFKKVNPVASKYSCDSGCNFVPLSLSIRAIRIQNYSLQAELAWERMLPLEVNCGISSNLPATEKSVLDLEAVVFGDNNDGEFSCSISECAVCLKDFKEGEEIKRMPCFHVYHKDCIVEWLKKSHVCPCCRFPMPVCRVVEGAFPFYRRKHCRAAVVGGKSRRTPRMSTRFQVY